MTYLLLPKSPSAASLFLWGSIQFKLDNYIIEWVNLTHSPKVDLEQLKDVGTTACKSNVQKVTYFCAYTIYYLPNTIFYHQKIEPSPTVKWQKLLSNTLAYNSFGVVRLRFQKSLVSTRFSILSKWCLTLRQVDED